MGYPELIVMLTYKDQTVEDAFRIFEECKNTKAGYWGFKEEPLPLEQMKELFSYMRSCGKNTSLEVVAYTEEECLEGARKAAACEVDVLMGTMYYESVHALCRANGIRYMPFVGEIFGRPSVLKGNIEDMIEEACRYADKGVDGIDLLGYRYIYDPVDLNRKFVRAMKDLDVPVCIAGSVNSYRRLDEILDADPFSFTIGGAFFDHAFGETFPEQIDKVYEYIQKNTFKA